MHKRRLLLVIFLLFIFSGLYLSAQNKAMDERSLGFTKLMTEVDRLSETSLDSALHLLTQAIEKPNLNKTSHYYLLFKMAQINSKQQNYTASQNNLTQAVEIAAHLQNESWQVESLVLLGKVQRRLGNYDQALQADLKALTLVENSGQQKLFASICNNIGIDHYRYHNFDEAILYFTRSKKIREKMGDHIGVADCYNNLGMVFDDQAKLDTALQNYRQALVIYQKEKELDGIAASYNNLAGIAYQQNDFPKVMQYMLKVIDLRRKDGDKRKLSFSMMNVASLYYSQQNMPEAIKLYAEGLQLAKQIDAKSQKRIGYKGLSDAFLAQGNYQKAMENHQLYTQVKDSIFEENKTRTIAEMHTKYETEKKEMENQLLKNENKIKSRNLILLIILTLVLIALSLMLIYYLRLRSRNLKQQKVLNEVKLARKEQEKKHLQDIVFAEKQINRLQKEKFESEMALKNKQLMSSMACLVNKNEVLGKLKAEIKASESTFEQKKEIIHFINVNTDMDTDWKKFRIDFEEAHPGFFDRLQKSFPDLSETYQKISALLRIGLSSQEIADILFVSLATVNKNRQRLRKKLNLAPESNLTHFLETI